MAIDVAVLAGGASTAIFAGSVMPMIVKAVRTRDLASYSLGNLLLANTGNLIHSVYVFSLPAGPLWVLHGFYLVTTAFMLAMYLRHVGLRSRPHLPRPAGGAVPSPSNPGRPAGVLIPNHLGSTSP